MRLRPLSPASGAIAIALAVLTPACADLLGLGKYTNLCSGEIDAPNVCRGGGGGSSSASSSGQGGGTAGGATGCTPDTVKTCYDGPNGTKDVGICKHGQEICNPSGDGYGACKGEVLPAVESCKSTEDENCDGLDCVIWANRHGAPTSDDRVVGLAVDPQDQSIVVVGSFTGSINWGGDHLLSRGNTGLFLAKVDSSGKASWAKQLGDDVGADGTAVAVDQHGQIYIAGQVTGASATTYVGATITPGKFLVKAQSDGSPVWVKNMGPKNFVVVPGTTSLAALPSGDVAVAGNCGPGVDVGDGVKACDLYVATLRGSDGFGSTTGASGYWARLSTSSGSSLTDGLWCAPDAAGDVLVAGHFSGTITFLGRSLVSSGLDDIVLARLNPQGASAWVDSFGGSDDEKLDSMSVDSNGDLLMSGYSSGSFYYDGSNQFDPGQGNGFLIKWGGTNVFSYLKQWDLPAQRSGVASDSHADALVFLPFEGTLDFGGGAVDGGAGAVLLAKLSPSGAVEWQRSYASMSANMEPFVASAHHATVTASSVYGPINFGTGTLDGPTGTNYGDVVVAQFGE